jgi:acetoacetate decarboxylase
LPKTLEIAVDHELVSKSRKKSFGSDRTKPTTESDSEGFSLPLSAPPYGPPPFYMESCKQVLVQFETEVDALARIIPKPFELPARPFACAFVGDMLQIPGPGRYHEGAVLIGVEYRGKLSTYAPYLWTSSDEALLVGRELYGMPKMMCEPETLSEDGNEIVGVLRRRHGPLVRVAFTYRKRGKLSDLPTTPDRLCLRKIPSPDPRVPGVRQVVYTKLENYRLGQIWEGTGDVTFFGSAHSDVHLLRPKRIVNAWYIESSWVLPWGEVLEGEPSPTGQGP